MDFEDQRRYEKMAKPLATREWAQVYYWLARAGKWTRTLEIGIGNGYTSLCLARAMKENSGKHTAVDIDDDRIIQLYSDLWSEGLDKHCDRAIDDSKEFVKTITGKFDFIHIDGYHQYNYVKHDVEKYLPYLKDYGTMAVHDVDLISGPRRFLREFQAAVHAGTLKYNLVWWPFCAGVAFITNRFDRPLGTILEKMLN